MIEVEHIAELIYNCSSLFAEGPTDLPMGLPTD